MAEKFQFAAIDLRYTDNIPEYKESEIKGKEMVSCGEDNKFPSYLYDLSMNCPTLSSILKGMVDYVIGDGVECNIKGFEDYVNPDDTIEDLLSKLLDDYGRIGYCAFEVLRKVNGKIDRLNWLDARMVRSDKNNEGFWYSEDFAKSTSYVRTNKAIFLPRFRPEHPEVARSIVFIKTPHSRGAYGLPLYYSALRDVVVENKITDFHLNELSNNFLASAILNFRNGIPTDEEKSKIEKEIKNKFGSANNAARFLLNFSEGPDNSTTIERLDSDDFDERYASLAKKTRENIFVAMRAFPILFAQDYENKGFSDSDFMEAFKIYNKTVILPIQKQFARMFDKVFGAENSVTFKPFSLSFEKEEDDEEVTGNEVE